MKSFTRLPPTTPHHSLLASTVLTRILDATNTLLEQPLYDVWLPTSGFRRVIRHPSGRHPVFTGKPLKPGLRTNNTQTSQRVDDDSVALFHLLHCCALARHWWPFKRAWATEMRGVLLDWAALKQELRWSLLIFIAAQQLLLFLSSSAVSLPPLLKTGWAQCRRPQTRQTAHFSYIVSIPRSHCVEFEL